MIALTSAAGTFGGSWQLPSGSFVSAPTLRTWTTPRPYGTAAVHLPETSSAGSKPCTRRPAAPMAGFWDQVAWKPMASAHLPRGLDAAASQVHGRIGVLGRLPEHLRPRVRADVGRAT